MVSETRAVLRSILLALLLGGAQVAVPPLVAQSLDDGVMMPKRMASVGVLYAHDSWDQYWEGTLKRSNGNIGTLTTQSLTLVGGYGITDRLSVMAMLPYVWTQASDGPLHGLSGLQDVSVAAKFRLLSTPFTNRGGLSAFLVASASLPATDYTPDFMPLSIGSGGGRASGRFTLSFDPSAPWFLNASAGYVWCNNVKLDRQSYYTNGQLYNSNEVAMPDVVDYTFRAGYRSGRIQIPVALIQQRTLGGGDIRRQDMPFVSNRMDFVKLDGAVIYGLTVPKDVSVRVGFARVMSGRNVGQSTTFTSGLVYAFGL